MVPVVQSEVHTQFGPVDRKKEIHVPSRKKRVHREAVGGVKWNGEWKNHRVGNAQRREGQ